MIIGKKLLGKNFQNRIAGQNYWNCKNNVKSTLFAIFLLISTPAYFSPNDKLFDQFLQTVKNKTTVLILVFKKFLQTSIRPLISVLYAKGYHDFPLKNFCLTVPKNFVEEPFCVSEIFWYRKMLGIREGAGITIFCQNCFVSQYRKTS